MKNYLTRIRATYAKTGDEDDIFGFVEGHGPTTTDWSGTETYTRYRVEAREPESGGFKVRAYEWEEPYEYLVQIAETAFTDAWSADYLELRIDTDAGEVVYDFSGTTIATTSASLEHFAPGGTYVCQNSGDFALSSAEWENTMQMVRSHNTDDAGGGAGWQYPPFTDVTNGIQIQWATTNLYSVQMPAAGLEDINETHAYTEWDADADRRYVLAYRYGFGDGNEILEDEWGGAVWGWFDVFGGRHILYLLENETTDLLYRSRGVSEWSASEVLLENRVDMVACRMKPSNDVLIVTVKPNGDAKAALLQWSDGSYSLGTEYDIIARNVEALGDMCIRPDGRVELWYFANNSYLYHATGEPDGSDWS